MKHFCTGRKIIATIEARMTSRRLPGKVLLEVHGKPMLALLIERLKTVTLLDEIVLATTTNSTDDVLVNFADRVGIKIFRGSEQDVMSRVIGAADSVAANLVVEITGDCPIIDPQVVAQGILTYLNNNVDYVGNAHVRSYPDGMDVQVFSLDALKRSESMTQDPLDREHVTTHIRNNPDLFSQIHLIAPPELFWPELGLTLDESADYELLKRIIEYYQPQYTFSCLDVISLLKANPSWININQAVQRKGYA